MVICIVGPTGVGKTKLSVELAKKLNGEIINADSTQVYKGIDVATAKITDNEKEGIPHYLFDIKTIEEDYTVYDYQKDARKVIDDILKRGKTPILVGGTGLYIKACLYDYKFNEELNKKDYSSLSLDELYQQLLKIDPNTNIHHNNRKRIERALDYYYSNNETLSSKEKTNKLIVIVGRILVLVLFIGIWELLTSLGVIDSFIYSSPSRIVKMLVSLFKEGKIIHHSLITLYETVLAFTISMVVGTIIAILLFSSKRIREILEPYLIILNSLPKVALGPLIIVWFGAGTKAIVVMGFLICIIITIISLLNSFMSVSKEKILLMKK